MNIYIIELFLFFEKGTMVLSILFIAIALYYFNEEITLHRNVKKTKKNKVFKINKNIVIGISSMIIAVFSYQGTAGLFLILASSLIILNYTTFSNFIKNNFKMAIIYIVPAVINVLTVSLIFNNRRLSGENFSIANTFDIIIEQFTKMLPTTFELLPMYFFVGIVGILILIIIGFSIYRKKLGILTGMLYVILVCFVSSIGPYLLLSANEVWIVPRSVYPFASIIGIIMFYICAKEHKNRFIIISILTLSTLYLITQLIYSYDILVDRYKLNYMDNYVSGQIIDVVEEYENKNGIIVEKIAIYNDLYMTYEYPNIETIKDMNISGFIPSWSIVLMINHFTGRNFEEVEANFVIQEECNKKNYTYFSENLLIFDNDTVHYCRY